MPPVQQPLQQVPLLQLDPDSDAANKTFIALIISDGDNMQVSLSMCVTQLTIATPPGVALCRATSGALMISLQTPSCCPGHVYCLQAA